MAGPPAYLLIITFMVEHYEVLAIFSGMKTEEEAKSSMDKFQETLRSHGANITKVDVWGKRKLGYEIEHLRHGYYLNVEFDLDTQKLHGLDEALRLSDDVVRHQILRRVVQTAEALAKIAALRERIAAKREQVKEKEAAAMVSEKPAAAAPVEPVAPVAQEKLAAKLEEILESDKVDV